MALIDVISEVLVILSPQKTLRRIEESLFVFDITSKFVKVRWHLGSR